MAKSVLLIGATGGLGRQVCTELLKDIKSFGRVGIFVNTSRPLGDEKKAQLETLKTGGMEIVTAADYADPQPYRGFESVVILLGNHGLHLQPTIIDAAIEAGVRHFYPSEFGADLLVGKNWDQRYYRYKAITRLHLEKRGQDIPDLGWTYYVLGRLTEWSVIKHFGFDVPNAKAKIFGTENGRQSLVSVKDTALYLTELLKTESPADQAPGRRTVRLPESTVTYSEIFRILEGVTGKKFEVTYLDVEKAEAEEQDARERGDIEAELATSHKLVQGREGTLVPQPWDNAMFPHIKPATVQESLEAAFKAPWGRRMYGL